MLCAIGKFQRWGLEVLGLDVEIPSSSQPITFDVYVAAWVASCLNQKGTLTLVFEQALSCS